ncbi:MAG: hypothetical protein GWN86_23330, partial [Desulfobacterales bacterium]|nr:hypothetical protein [Desulfobacterales bacterium]
METKKILDTVFEGHNLTTAIWGGRIVWIASEVSMALGYSKPGKISTLVSTKWADDFVEDEDFQVLKGDRFQKFAGFDDLSWGASKR